MSQAIGKPNRVGPIRRLYRVGHGIFALIGLLFVLYLVSIDVSQVHSPSMSPTLCGTSSADGDWVLVEKITYWFRSPRRWEIVQFFSNDGYRVCKRVVGLPGERVEIRDLFVMIDGQPLARPESLPFLKYYNFGPHAHRGESIDCSEGYFLLGDDSKDSQDSRFDGPLDPERIRGRAVMILWPPSRMGVVR